MENNMEGKKREGNAFQVVYCHTGKKMISRFSKRCASCQCPQFSIKRPDNVCASLSSVFASAVCSDSFIVNQHRLVKHAGADKCVSSSVLAVRDIMVRKGQHVFT